jgi:hypothetical protein
VHAPSSGWQRQRFAGGRAQFAQDGADIRATADLNGRIIGKGNIDDEVVFHCYVWREQRPPASVHQLRNTPSSSRPTPPHVPRASAAAPRPRWR